ncbi:MAG: hypothetical protein IT373_38215 [Polyangiaceae bacterium]|nr:hypothetical protein [Polyangiaceae bacterium]
MSPVLVWALSVAGAALALVGAVLVLGRTLNAPIVLRSLERIIEAGNWQKARRLCRATGTTSAGRVAGHALELRLEAHVDRASDGASAGYRQAPDEVPLAERARAALAPVAAAERRRLWPALLLALVGGGSAGASLVRAPSADAQTALALVGLLLAAWTVRERVRLGRGLDDVVSRMSELVRPGDAMHDEP